MRNPLSLLLPAVSACLIGCAPAGYHYETGGFTPTKNEDNGAPNDPLVWCRQAGLDQRVPMSVCQSALNKAPTIPTSQREAVEQCVRRVSASGYVQSYSGEIYALCARAIPAQ